MCVVIDGPEWREREHLKKDKDKFSLDTYQRKNGSQHSRNTPIIIPNVRAALCSARHPLAGRIEPSWKKKNITQKFIHLDRKITKQRYYGGMSYDTFVRTCHSHTNSQKLWKDVSYVGTKKKTKIHEKVK